jgi:hypothetical protein
MNDGVDFGLDKAGRVDYYGSRDSALVDVQDVARKPDLRRRRRKYRSGLGSVFCAMQKDRTFNEAHLKALAGANIRWASLFWACR